MISFGSEPGWLGEFTRHQEPGAFPNGSRVFKASDYEPGDATPFGTGATVLGSLDGRLVEIYNPQGERIDFFYFVEWDDKPRIAVGVVDWKLERLP